MNLFLFKCVVFYPMHTLGLFILEHNTLVQETFIFLYIMLDYILRSNDHAQLCSSSCETSL